MKQENIIYSGIYQSLPINSNEELGLGCHEEILERIYERLICAFEHHSQVWVSRMDFHYPNNGEHHPHDNSAFRHFISSFIKRLKLDGLSPSYVWSREHEIGNSNPHWHLILILNGNLTQSGYRHFETAKRLWLKTLGTDSDGIVHMALPQSELSWHHNGFKITRHDPLFNDKLCDLYHWLSYISKERSKYHTGKVKAFGCSELN
jgi:hypothetical protein